MQPEKALVTIGVPVYNGERFLEQCLDSLLSQTYRDFVLVISDNASTDRTQEICGRYAKADPRVRYHRNPVNIGLYGNFNRLQNSVRAVKGLQLEVDEIVFNGLAACLIQLDGEKGQVMVTARSDKLRSATLRVRGG